MGRYNCICFMEEAFDIKLEITSSPGVVAKEPTVEPESTMH